MAEGGFWISEDLGHQAVVASSSKTSQNKAVIVTLGVRSGDKNRCQTFLGMLKSKCHSTMIVLDRHESPSLAAHARGIVWHVYKAATN